MARPQSRYEHTGIALLLSFLISFDAGALKNDEAAKGFEQVLASSKRGKVAQYRELNRCGSLFGILSVALDKTPDLVSELNIEAREAEHAELVLDTWLMATSAEWVFTAARVNEAIPEGSYRQSDADQLEMIQSFSLNFLFTLINSGFNRKLRKALSQCRTGEMEAIKKVGGVKVVGNSELEMTLIEHRLLLMPEKQ